MERNNHNKELLINRCGRLKDLRTWFINPYHVWVLLTCLVINFWILIRICRVCSCRLKARRVAGAINRQVQRMQRRQQPEADRAAKLQHLELALQDVNRRTTEAEAVDASLHRVVVSRNEQELKRIPRKGSL